MRRHDALVGSAVLIVAAALRWDVLGQPYIPDELGNAFHATAWELFWNPEAGVNPPLFRILVNAPFDEAGTLRWGRRLSLLMGVLAVAGTYVAALRASRGSTWAALLAALLLAVDPHHIQASIHVRAYATWTAVASWHVASLVAWSQAIQDGDEDRRRRHVGQVVISAILLPWLHYLSVPWMLLLGLAALALPASKDLAKLYIPAAVAIAPMGWHVVTMTSARVATTSPLGEVLTEFAALQVQAVARFVAPLRDLGLDLWQAQAVLWALATLPVGLVWRRLEAADRLLAAAVLTFFATVAVLSPVQLVRSPAVVMLLVVWLPLAVAWPRVVGPRGVAHLLRAGVVALVGPGLVATTLHARSHPKHQGLEPFARQILDTPGRFEGRPVYATPEYATMALYHHTFGQHIRSRAGREHPACGEEPSCFVAGPVLVRALREPRPQVTGWVVSFEVVPPHVAARCREVERTDGWTLHDCPDS